MRELGTMRTVELTTKEFKTVPGYSTEISVSRWKGKIDALLYEIEELPKCRVIRQAWLKEKDRQTLLLEIEADVGNVTRHVSFQIEPVIIMRKRKVGGRWGRLELVKEEMASWKLFHDLLERKIAAVRLGLTELHHEFMPYISKSLPDGSMGTFADFLDLVLEQQPGLEGLQLEDQREAKIIEANVIDNRGG